MTLIDWKFRVPKQKYIASKLAAKEKYLFVAKVCLSWSQAYKKKKKEKKVKAAHNNFTWKIEVWLPEKIVFGLQQKLSS